MTTEGALSTLPRYEALFELASEINVATEILGAGAVLARRLKYVADVYSWRYFCLELEDEASSMGRQAMVIDTDRGAVTVEHIPWDQLCSVELDLWRRERPSFLEDEELDAAKLVLPEQFKKNDIVQLFVCPKFGAGKLQSILLFSKRRAPFNELETKFLTLGSQIFHDKVYLLWQQEKLRDLEKAYLQQEIMLRQSEKLATLGKLSAGMAHELNNPAAAAQRSAGQLRTAIDQLDAAQRDLGAAALDAGQMSTLADVVASLKEATRSTPELDPIARADLEDELEHWLEQRGVEEAWELAPALASLGWDPPRLAEIVAPFSLEQLPVILTSLNCEQSASTLVEEIQVATGRISEIVNALKSYTYLDQAPVQRVDVHEGLNSTLIILRGKLTDGITVQRDFDPTLPQIEAFGTELNQVWTNIIDNAIGAMDGEGELVLRTYHEDPWIVVEIQDTGSGIPDEIQSKIFDPFFTTKPPGQGTGLGLNITHNIVVQKHHGRIEVRSSPGKTCFAVKLPLDVTSPATADEVA